MKRKTKKNKIQRTFIYCPKCGTELISTHSFVEERLFYTYFGCKNCGTESMWDFDTPVPLLMHSKEGKKDGRCEEV